MRIVPANEQKPVRAAYADGPRLLADIGVTHARFTLETAPGVAPPPTVLRCDDYPDIVALLQAYLSTHCSEQIAHAAFAMALPISGDQVRMTNRDWQFSTDALRRTMGWSTLLVVNDFTALAMAVPGLGADGVLQIGGGAPVPHAVAGALGPGSGLGMSGVIPTADGFITLGSEGGHVDFAPGDEREFAILQWAWREWSHVSIERILSAPGLELVYRALGARNGVLNMSRSAANIVAGALDEHDPLCLEVLDCFAGMLGAAAANLALTLGALGGIYIGGGIVPRIAQWFASSQFRTRFEAKGRFSAYLAAIPTYVILDPLPELRGVAAILSEHLRGRAGANTVMERIKHLQHELSPAEQRVASLVIAHPRKVLSDPIAEIARVAQVSQPTVIRFCRSLGFQGLAEFKLKFAGSLTGSIPVRHSQVRMSDSTHDLSAKVIDNTVSAILKFRNALDVHAIDRAIALLRQANKVEFYAMGNARVVALDGQHKFFRFRIPSTAHSDAHLFTLAAELLQAHDVVIAISTTGQAPELLAAVDAARKAGADVIAITSSKSALAKKATVCLAVDHAEDSAMFLSMISRILQLLLIDIMAVGISLGSQAAPASDAEARRLLISHLDL